MYKNIYVTIKATLRCNLACQYCYGRDNHAELRQMDAAEVRQAIDFAYGYAQEVGAESLTICWHGGEPFLMINRLPEFIDYANRLFSNAGIRVEHGSQTNATLLKPSTYETIKNYFGGYIGVSVDLYSRFRTFANGEDSTNYVVKNIDAALAAGIRLGAINLITGHNKNRIDDIYDFYKQRKMNVRLARVFPIAEDDTLTNPMYVSDEEFANAMIRYFDLWAVDTSPAYNSDIISLVCDLLLGKPSICLRENNCHQRYMALAPGGDIFSCAEFDTPDTVIGNFIRQSPHEFAISKARQLLADRAPVPTECHSCRYEKTCHGLCLRERYMLKYPYRCKSYKMYWNHIVEWLEQREASLYMLYGLPREKQSEVISQIFKH